MNVYSSRFVTIVPGFLPLCQTKGGFGERGEAESLRDVRRLRAVRDVLRAGDNLLL